MTKLLELQYFSIQFYLIKIPSIPTNARYLLDWWDEEVGFYLFFVPPCHFYLHTRLHTPSGEVEVANYYAYKLKSKIEEAFSTS